MCGERGEGFVLGLFGEQPVILLLKAYAQEIEIVIKEVDPADIGAEFVVVSRIFTQPMPKGKPTWGPKQQASNSPS